jgi:hypothetical protein
MPRAKADPATPPANARPAIPQAKADPATPPANTRPTMHQAKADPAPPQANTRPTMHQANADPATPAVPPANARPITPQATAHPAINRQPQICGGDSGDVAGLPIDQIQQAVAPDAAQRAALDDLANASVKAAQDIRAACPTQIPSTAPARLGAMQQRVETMIAAVGTVQPALDKFYGLLSDQQKARLDAVGPNQRSKLAPKAAGAIAQNCGAAQRGTTDWPSAEIESRLHPTDAQRASLAALVDASAKATNMLIDACLPQNALTPPARLAAAGKRLEVMLLAIKTVLTTLDDFYDRLTDEQKVGFEAIGPGRSAAASRESDAGEQTAAPAARRHNRRHGASIGGGII